MSEIQKFYKDQTVFITGGTGFMGKILIEKLLRSTEVATIFLLVRPKGGKDVHTRLDEMFEDVVFDRLKQEVPKFKHRVVGVAGDCALAGLGLGPDDWRRVADTASVVLHAAATVRFDEGIKLAYAINVNGLRSLLGLCRAMPRLRALVHVSTAYSNCHLREIDERFYECPVDYEAVGALLEKVGDGEAARLTPQIIGSWPNTYTFTKALAESLIAAEGGGLPVAVFRPAIIISTFREPIDGWIDNLYGPTGMAAGVATGLCRIMYCDKRAVADVVPVDTCVAGLISAAWDVACRKCDKAAAPNIPIYNYVSSCENSVTWGEYIILNQIHGKRYPPKKSLWTIKFHANTNYNAYLFYRLLYHILPALILDAFGAIVGQKTKLSPMYKKIHKFSDVLSFFSMQEWKFTNKNTQNLWSRMGEEDRALFPMSMRTVSWLTYFRSYFKGIRQYLLQESFANLEEARTRKWRFDIVHNTMNLLFNFLFVFLIWTVISRTIMAFVGGNITIETTTNLFNNRTIYESS